MELTPIQKDIIIALINLQRQKDRAIKGEEIAEFIQRNPGTIRNQMQLLKALGLVEGVPDRKGDINPQDRHMILYVFSNLKTNQLSHYTRTV